MSAGEMAVERSRRHVRWGSIAVFLGACALYLGLLWNHILSRDEAHAMLLASFHPAPLDLLAALRYEGTPGLWHFLLWGLDRFGALDPGILKGLYGVILIAFSGVVALALPIPLVFRAAILIQVPAFWYAINVRQYLLGVVLVLSWAALRARHSDARSGLENVVLALLAQCSLISVPLAAGLLGFTIIEDRVAFGRRWNGWWLLGGFGVLLGAAQLRPAPDLMEGLRRWQWTLERPEDVIWRQLMETLWVEPVSAAIFLGLLVFLGIHTARVAPWRLGAALAAIAPAVVLDAVLGLWKYTGERHHWTVSFGLVALGVVLTARLPALHPPFRWLTPLVGGLALAIAGSYAASEIPLRLGAVRSDGGAAAAWIRNHAPGVPLLGMSEYYSAPVRACLKPPPPIYSLDRGDWVRATRWNHPGVDYLANPMAEVVLMPDLLRRLAGVPESLLRQEPLLLVSGRQVLFGARSRPGRRIRFGEGWELVPVASFQNAQVERYRIYRVYRSGHREGA